MFNFNIRLFLFCFQFDEQTPNDTSVYDFEHVNSIIVEMSSPGEKISKICFDKNKTVWEGWLFKKFNFLLGISLER